MTTLFSYQVLLDAVSSATSCRGAVYPNDYNYLPIALSDVQNVVSRYQPSPWVAEVDDCDDKARRLWYLFKESYPLSGCGMIRLMAPVAHDIVGVVTVEDLRAGGIVAAATGASESASRDMLSDDLAEYQDDALQKDSAKAMTNGIVIPNVRGDRRNGGGGGGGGGSTGGVEMTLIEPQTKRIFKRSQGGAFGTGGWPVSQIQAVAVWF